MAQDYTDQQLQAYLDEALSSELMARIEQSLRSDEDLRERLVAVAETREAGIHSLGEIWRRNRISCPDRQQLASYLLGALDEEQSNYIKFHLQTIQCRYCLANLEDLQRLNKESQSAVQTRRRKYFQTSAGYLSNKKKSP